MNNIDKLIIHKMSLDAIPNGGSLMDGIEFLSNKDKIASSARDAKKWVMEAIKTIRLASEPNPYKNLTDDEIAGIVLKKVKSKRKK